MDNMCIEHCFVGYSLRAQSMCQHCRTRTCTLATCMTPLPAARWSVCGHTSRHRRTSCWPTNRSPSCECCSDPLSNCSRTIGIVPLIQLMHCNVERIVHCAVELQCRYLVDFVVCPLCCLQRRYDARQIGGRLAEKNVRRHMQAVQNGRCHADEE